MSAFNVAQRQLLIPCRMLMAVVLAIQLHAAAQGFQVRNWHIENGLPDSTITALAQTPDGYLWVGTRKGLARFDGDSFKRVEVGKRRAGGGETALADSSVVGLLADRQGGLWIACESGWLLRFADGECRPRYAPGTLPGDVNAPAATQSAIQTQPYLGSIFALDSAGAVWARTITGGVIRFSPSGAASIVPWGNLPSGEVRSLLSDGTGRVWVLKDTNACFFDNDQWNYSPELNLPGSSQMLSASGAAGFWTAEVSGSDGLAERLEYKESRGWSGSSLTIPTTPVHAPVSAMLQDRQGRVWLGITWAGVYAKPQNSDWMRVQAAGPLAKSTARCLFEDRQGDIWVGTAGEGLDQVLEPSVQMELLPPEAANVHATTVCATREGAIWIGTDKGLYRRAPGAPRVSLLEELNEESVFSVFEDTQTNLWVGAHSGLFHQESPGFKKVLPIPPDFGGIVCLYEDRAGNLWAGGPHGSLFCRRAPLPGAAFETIAAPASLYICNLAEDTQGQIWVATRMAGLWRVDGRQLVAAGPQFAPVGANLRALLCDQEGALWISTYGNGLFRWNNQALQHYTTGDGLPDDVIIGLMGDDEGHLWMTSLNGIFGCSRRQLAEYQRGQSAPLLCLHLGPDEGLANRECTGPGQPVMTRSPDGRFWAATMVGAAGFAPGRLTRTAAAAEVRVESLSVDGQARPPGAQGFRIPASSRHFEFQYSAPELAAPKTLRFRHRLDGLDPNWVEAGHGRLASYSRLLPGEYHFRVMVGGADGVWREAQTPITLWVVPRYWQTRWFRVLSAAILAGALVGSVAWNERRKARRRMERLEAQEAMEKMRHRIARDLHDELGSAITEIIQLGDLTLQPDAATKTLRASVESMTGRVRQLGITVDEIVWTMSSRNDTLPNLAGYISSHAQEFFRHSGIRCRLDVTKHLPGTKVDSQTRHNLFLAVKEALNNVAKHSGANEVIVRVHYRDELLRVTIEDNGRGFDAATVQPGEGLANMRERLEAVKGRVEFLSHPGGGSKVVFTLGLNGSPGGGQGENPQS
jgi:ligand-binding sensor domain-containing protein/signal transduction histidine kinase